MLDVVFYRTEGGNEPVLDWLRGLGPEDRRIVGEDLRTAQLGWPLGMPLCRPLGSGLFEVRSSPTGKRISRLIFFQHDDCLVVVEGFVKKSRATPHDVLNSHGGARANMKGIVRNDGASKSRHIA